MHLMTCEHPQRVYNMYIGEYVWTTCGKCNTCRNAKAARWTDALERERLQHRYCFFVTLTYDDRSLPLLRPDNFIVNWTIKDFKDNNTKFVASRLHDTICIPFNEIDFEKSDSDIELFSNMISCFGGIPYCSTTDIQYFNKRLNKYFFDNVTSKFKNFRYFVVQEFGSTTFRPHVHGIYYTDSKECAAIFQNAVDICWKYGIADCKFVESSACSYVAQYVNKFSDLPLFYQKAPLAPRYFFSKHIGCQDISNTFGTGSDGSSDIYEIFDKCLVETPVRRKGSDTKFVVRPIDKSTENYLFPKCPFFKQVSSSCRIELYNISRRFAQGDFENFFRRVVDYIVRIYEHPVYSLYLLNTEFSDFLYNVFYKDWISDDEDKHNRAYGWLRRLYYLSRRVVRLSCIFKVSVSTYVEKIIEYFDKKELYLLKKMYSFQTDYVSKNNKEYVSDDIALMYPEFLTQNIGVSIGEFLTNYVPLDVRLVREDSLERAYSNKKTHFKNAYLDSLKLKESYKLYFNHLKHYFYAKKCNETLEAFAT